LIQFQIFALLLEPAFAQNKFCHNIIPSLSTSLP
jgi:hypothetical protein